MRRVLLLTAVLCSGSAIASANGIVSHMHISDLAVGRLPEGELANLLRDPAMLEIYRAGSVFPDSGYAADDDYGEIAHWEPFTESYVRWIRDNYPPPFDGDEARTHVAFLLGQASHGLADQVFDSLFMARTDVFDGTSENLDVGAETWLIIEHDPNNRIMGFVPAEMHDVFAGSELVGYAPTTEALGRGRDLITRAVSALYAISWTLYEGYWVEMPWAATHYYEADRVPGSLPHIAAFVAAYWEVLWERLHERDEFGSSIGSWPADGAVNFEVNSDRIETRALIAFGHGVDRASLTSEHVRFIGPSGPVESTARFIYGSEYANAVLVKPDADLEYDTDYVVEVRDITTFGGARSSSVVSFQFRTRCAPDRLSECPPLDSEWTAPDPLLPPIVPRPPRPDGGPIDAATGDATRSDATLDAQIDGGGDTGSSGCSCRSSDVGTLWPLTLLFLVRRR